MGEQWPAVKAEALRRLLVNLCGEPVTSGGGSHQKFPSRDGQRTFIFAHHGREVSGSAVRSILVSDVGLTPAEARRALQKGKL